MKKNYQLVLLAMVSPALLANKYNLKRNSVPKEKRNVILRKATEVYLSGEDCDFYAHGVYTCKNTRCNS